MRERVYEKAETINPRTKKTIGKNIYRLTLWNGMCLMQIHRSKYTLSTEEFTYVEPENIEELFSIYQDINC